MVDKPTSSWAKERDFPGSIPIQTAQTIQYPPRSLPCSPPPPAPTPQNYHSSTFKQSEPGIPDKGFDYSRGGNPSRNSLEEALAALHGAKHGFAWSSGLGGTVSILHLLKPGDHVVAMHDLYGGTNRLFRQIGMPMGITFDFVDATDAENVARAIRPETKVCRAAWPSVV